MDEQSIKIIIISFVTSLVVSYFSSSMKLQLGRDDLQGSVDSQLKIFCRALAGAIVDDDASILKPFWDPLNVNHMELNANYHNEEIYNEVLDYYFLFLRNRYREDFVKAKIDAARILEIIHSI